MDNNYGYSYYYKICSHEGFLSLNGAESQTSFTSFHNLVLVSNEVPEFCVLLSRTTYWSEPSYRSAYVGCLWGGKQLWEYTRTDICIYPFWKHHLARINQSSH